MTHFLQRAIVGTSFWVVSLLSSGAVQAHIGNSPAGITPFYESGELVGAATNLGLVQVTEGLPTWYTQLRIFGAIHWYAYTSDERVLVGTDEGLVATEDWGCSWDTVDGFGDIDVPSVLYAEDSTQPLLIGTGTPQDSNRLYHSTDGGVSWAGIDETTSSGRFVGLSRSVGGMSRVALSVLDSGAEIHWQPDPSAGWQNTIVGIEGSEPRLLGVNAVGTEVYLSTYEGERIETPSEVGEDLPPTISYDGVSRIYSISLPGGVVSLTGELNDCLVDSGAMDSADQLWLTDSLDGLHTVFNEQLTLSYDGIGHCIRNPIGTGLVACGERPQEHAFYTQEEDGAWSGVLEFEEIVGELCPDKEPVDDEQDVDDTGGNDESGDDTTDTDLSSGSDSGAAEPDSSIDEPEVPQGGDVDSTEALPATPFEGGEISESGCRQVGYGNAWWSALLLMLWGRAFCRTRRRRPTQP